MNSAKITISREMWAKVMGLPDDIVVSGIFYNAGNRHWDVELIGNIPDPLPNFQIDSLIEVGDYLAGKTPFPEGDCLKGLGRESNEEIEPVDLISREGEE